tara:strand:+ start:574 stop:1152 length:579 start_codon:yes stop_codon:yes gene_type:complete
VKKIGLTGGIGSGKSFVAKQIEAMGYPVYYSDNQAKKISNENPLVRESLISLVGPLVYENNKINKEYLRAQLFSNEELRGKVNAIVHPAVRADFSRWLKEQKTSDLIFNEAAILFETGAYKNFDAVILVYAPEEVKIDRLLRRDRSSRSEIKLKMQAQWNDKRKKTLTRYHILNDGKKSIEEQLNAILAQLL